MKVAIASSGNTVESLVDERFGRCSYFALFNSDSGETKFYVNDSKNATEGAGPAAVRFIANLEADKIVSGEFGMKIKSLLNDLNIQMIIMKQDKTIEEVISLLKQQN